MARCVRFQELLKHFRRILRASCKRTHDKCYDNNFKNVVFKQKLDVAFLLNHLYNIGTSQVYTKFFNINIIKNKVKGYHPNRVSIL